jgi:hypothetical protein
MLQCHENIQSHSSYLDDEDRETLWNIGLMIWIDMLTHMKRFVLLVIAVVVDSHCSYLHPCPCVMDDSLDVITRSDRDMRLHPRTCCIAHHCPVHRLPWSVSLGLQQFGVQTQENLWYSVLCSSGQMSKCVSQSTQFSELTKPWNRIM